MPARIFSRIGNGTKEEIHESFEFGEYDDIDFLCLHFQKQHLLCNIDMNNKEHDEIK